MRQKACRDAQYEVFPVYACMLESWLGWVWCRVAKPSSCTPICRMLACRPAVQELILFSRADLERSIPCMVDGLKPGQRKILFACFKRNLKNDVKVAQLAGYVAEHSGGWA